METVSKLKT